MGVRCAIGLSHLVFRSPTSCLSSSASNYNPFSALSFWRLQRSPNSFGAAYPPATTELSSSTRRLPLEELVFAAFRFIALLCVSLLLHACLPAHVAFLPWRSDCEGNARPGSDSSRLIRRSAYIQGDASVTELGAEAARSNRSVNSAVLLSGVCTCVGFIEAEEVEEMAGADESNTAASTLHNDGEEKKPMDHGGHINLKVKGQDGGEVFFRIKSSATLRKLMNAYCERQSVDASSIAFLFDGRRLRAEQTPAELDMEDGDEIDAMLHQTGGGRLC